MQSLNQSLTKALANSSELMICVLRVLLCLLRYVESLCENPGLTLLTTVSFRLALLNFNIEATP